METIKVPPTKTPLTKDPAIFVLRNAWNKVMGSTPTPKQLAIIVAHWAFETGWGNSMVQYNFGNIKGVGPSGLTTGYTTHEGFGSTREKIKDGFRAYSNVMEGAEDYLYFLKNKYPSSMKCAEQEDVQGFVNHLTGYFTDSPQQYLSTVTQVSRMIEESMGIRPKKVNKQVAHVPKNKPSKKKSDQSEIDQIIKLCSHFLKVAIESSQSQVGTLELFFDDISKKEQFEKMVNNQSGLVIRAMLDYYGKAEQPSSLKVSILADPDQNKAAWLVDAQPEAIKDKLLSALNSEFKSLMGEDMKQRLEKVKAGVKKNLGDGGKETVVCSIDIS
jgi:arsenate reductase-like glutaredoxin family protein